MAAVKSTVTIEKFCFGGREQRFSRRYRTRIGVCNSRQRFEIQWIANVLEPSQAVWSQF